MSMNIDRTIAELTTLSIDDRLRVIQSVWDSIPVAADIPVTPEQQAELDRRVAAHDANPASAISREELVRRLKGKG